MTKATLKQYSVSLTSWFAEALPFREAGLEHVAKKLLLRFSGYGLRPLEVFQREGDRLFDYDLTFSLFNRSGSFRLTAEGLQVTFQNARDEKDAGIIADCLVGFLESLAGRRIRESRLEAFVHASLGPAEERDKFLRNLGPAERELPVGGSVLYFPAGETFGEVRFLVDRSSVFPEGVFLTWAAAFTQTLSQEALNSAAANLKGASGAIGLEFGSTSNP